MRKDHDDSVEIEFKPVKGSLRHHVSRKGDPGHEELVEMCKKHDDSVAALVYSMVNHPKHYNTGKFEVIDVIEDWKLDFNCGNAVKYIARAEHKGKQKEDLEKAIWYLQREVSKL